MAKTELTPKCVQARAKLTELGFNVLVVETGYFIEWLDRDDYQAIAEDLFQADSGTFKIVQVATDKTLLEILTREGVLTEEDDIWDASDVSDLLDPNQDCAILPPKGYVGETIGFLVIEYDEKKPI